MEIVAEQNYTRLNHAINGRIRTSPDGDSPSAFDSALAPISHISHMKFSTAARGERYAVSRPPTDGRGSPSP